MSAPGASTGLVIAVDIGNSRMRLAAFRGETLAALAERPTRRLGPGEVAGAWRELARAVWDLAQAQSATVAAVAPGAEAVAEALGAEETGFGGTIRMLTVTERSPLPHALETPETTGIDRLLAARAARELHAEPGAPVVVVQAGTALTVDLVDGGGVFRGGLILPGPELWTRGLGRAARIPLFNPDEVDWRLGEATQAEAARADVAASPAGASTRRAVLNGLAVGLGGALREAVRKTRNAAGAGAGLVVTGGWAERAARLLREADGAPVTVAPHLVLHGIRLAGRDDPA